MKNYLKFTTTAILASLLCFASYGQNSDRGRTSNATQSEGHFTQINQAQQWYDIESNEKSIAFLGWYGTMYNRRYDSVDLTEYTGYFNQHYKYDNNGTQQSLDDCTVHVRMEFIKTFFDQAKVLATYS